MESWVRATVQGIAPILGSLRQEEENVFCTASHSVSIS